MIPKEAIEAALRIRDYAYMFPSMAVVVARALLAAHERERAASAAGATPPRVSDDRLMRLIEKRYTTDEPIGSGIIDLLMLDLRDARAEIERFNARIAKLREALRRIELGISLCNDSEPISNLLGYWEGEDWFGRQKSRLGLPFQIAILRQDEGGA